MKILITGCSGFIGRNLKQALEQECEVFSPTRKQLDILNTELVEEYLKRHCFDVVIHTANTNDTKNINVTPYDALDGNLRMFYNLERCKDYFGKMYYFGSGAEYDLEHYVPDMTENYFGTHIPKDPYGFSKYIMSKSCKESGNIYDLRLFGVYGKYEEWHRRFISNAICRAIKGMPITISQNVYFDYLWVEDLAEIMKWFIENKPKYRHYNVCRGVKIDLYTLACKVREILGIDCDILVGKQGYKPEYTGCNKRMMDEIGTFEFTGWDESIKVLCEFYRENIDLIDSNKLL